MGAFFKYRVLQAFMSTANFRKKNIETEMDTHEQFHPGIQQSHKVRGGAGFPFPPIRQSGFDGF